MDEDWKQSLQMEDINQLCAKLQTSTTKGLSTTEARQRLSLNGKNKFVLPYNPDSEVKRYVSNCFKDFGIILFLSTICCFILYDMKPQTEDEIKVKYINIGVLLLIIFLLSGYFRYKQDNDDSDVVTAFKELMPMYCTVLRDGHKQIIRSENVVVGDILQITYGQRIAADVRFFAANDLEVNNVALSGYSLPEKISPSHDYNDDDWVAHNMGFACSHVTKGYGQGLVIACGNDTEVGIMARLCMEPRPSSRQRKHIQQVTYYTYTVGILMFFMVLCSISLEGLTFKMLITINVSLTLSLAPICVPALMFFGLWHTKNNMLKKGVYVRNLEAASTLGLTTVLFSRLRGTFTENHWVVSDVFADGREFDIENIQSEMTEQLLKLISVAVLCNDAVISPGQRGVPLMKRTMDGSEYEVAVLSFGMRHIHDINKLYRHNKRLAEKTLTHLKVTVHSTVNGQGETEYLLLVRGYLKTVLRHCSTFYTNNEEVQLGNAECTDYLNLGQNLKRLGRDYYAYGSKKLKLDNKLVYLVSKAFTSRDTSFFDQFMSTYCKSLCFLGIIAAENPPRANIGEAVDRCRNAGIKLVIGTAIKRHTAQAIAKSVGIIGKGSETVEDVAIRLQIPKWKVGRSMISAVVINMQSWHKKLQHQHWDTVQLLLSHVDLVFADIGVEQRHMIVDACQSLGAVVTVIGSSVYFTCAIRRANVGVAEVSSSPTCQSCADIILLENNFIALLNAIEESRLLFENMKKAFTYGLAFHMTAILVHASFIIMSIPFRIFLINTIVMDVFVNLLPGLSLLYEPAEEDLMKLKPKVLKDHLINRRVIFVAFIHVGLIQASAVFITYFAHMSYNGFLPRTLIGISASWYDNSNNDLLDSHGQEWTIVARERLEYQTAGAVMITLTIMQCVDLILSKTSRANLLKHGFGNVRLNIAVIYMICLACLLTQLNSPTNLRCLPVNYLPVLRYIWPWILLHIFTESARRYILRHFPGSWYEEETNFGHL